MESLPKPLPEHDKRITSMKKTKTIQKIKTWELELKTTFKFAYEHNAANVMFALGCSGYFTKCKREDGHFIVEIYQQQLTQKK